MEVKDEPIYNVAEYILTFKPRVEKYTLAYKQKKMKPEAYYATLKGIIRGIRTVQQRAFEAQLKLGVLHYD